MPMQAPLTNYPEMKRKKQMKTKIMSAFAGMLLAATAAQATENSIGPPVADPYTGNKCFQFWIQEESSSQWAVYAISLDGLPELSKSEEVRFAIANHKSITLVLPEDLDSPYRDSFPALARCYNSKGDSTYPSEYIIGVQVNK
jgi:hypothetical protein